MPASKSTKGAPAMKGKGSDPSAYTKPELRDEIKKKVTTGTKGGRAGQWSARKAQLVASEYKREGGDYKKEARNDGQTHLEKWTEEKWKTADGKPAKRGGTMARYLPRKAWDKLSPEEKKATDTKKRRASRSGKQFVANTAPAKKARKAATKK